MAVLLTVAFFFVPIAGLTWWFWPRPPLPPLFVVAFDQVTIPGQAVSLEAQLAAVEPHSSLPDLSGRELFFLDADRVRGADKVERARSDKHGAAKCSWPVAAADVLVEVLVRYVDPDQRHVPSCQARIFSWPAASKILIVEADALIDIGTQSWERDDLRDLPVLEDAAETLRAAVEERFQIVYLAPPTARATVYRAVRDWIERRHGQGDEPGLPNGPVLGAAAGEARAQVGRLQELYRGPFLAVARQAETAGVFRAAGITTIQIDAKHPWAQAKPQILK